MIASEMKPRGQLRRALAADLIQRIETAILAAASERRSWHLCPLREERRTQIVDGASRIGWLQRLK